MAGLASSAVRPAPRWAACFRDGSRASRPPLLVMGLTGVAGRVSLAALAAAG